MKSNFLLFLFLLSYGLICAQESSSIGDECVKSLQEYLAIDTTNPPGNEMETAKYLKQILDREGIENQIFDLGNNRANVFAILRGNGEKRPVILLHHQDVVPADASHWKVNPFSGKILDGEIYGRGAIDIKGKGMIDLFTMIGIKRLRLPLKRDIIFLAVADEEDNSLGTKWIVENKLDLIKNAEFLLDEGASILVDEKETYLVTMGEKSPLWLTLSFSGKAGHASVPIEDSAANRALRAGNRILNYKTEFMVLPCLNEYIRMLLGKEDITKIPGFTGDFDKSLKNLIFLEEISKNPEINACIRNTIAITCLKGSDKINTISNEASLGLDCRLLPGVDKDDFIKKLKEVVQDETVQIKIEEFSKSTSSSWDNEFSKALTICAKRRNPDAKVIASILLSSTDSTYYRPLGIQAYGFEPYKLTEEQGDLSHGNDERISVANVKFGIELLTDILRELN